MDLMYFVGAPGSGKSTLMAALTANCARYPQMKPFAHDVLLSEGKPIAAEMGRRREQFSGTDALAMNVQPKAVEWLRTHPYPLILGEGMRLGTKGFLRAAQDAGYYVWLIHLNPPQHVAKARRDSRGTGQNETWAKGAETRVKNLIQEAPRVLDPDMFEILELDSSGETRILLHALWMLTPIGALID